MPAPIAPNRGYSFTSFQTANPTSPPPGNQLDAEIDRSNAAINEVINFARNLIRDDGTLEHGSVGADQLAPDIFDGVVLEGAAQAQASATAAAQSAVSANQFRNEAQAAALSASSSLSSVTGTANTATAAAQTAQTLRDEALSFRNQADTRATDALNSANAAAASANDATLSRDLARKWATDTSGPVDDGLYSARFYAIATLGFDPAPPGVPAFSANLISFTPAPGISATNVQAALEEAYNESARTTHTHDAGAVVSGTFAIARLPVAASGVSSATEVVRADDARLSNARTPLAHVHAIADVTNLQTALDDKANINSPNFTGTPQVGGNTIWHAGNFTPGSYAVLTGPNTFTGLQQVAASAAGGATFRIPHGTAPTSPVNGDIWTTTTDLSVRINGATVNFARATHTHAIADVTGLTAALAGKEDAGVAVPRASGSTGAAVIPAGTTAQRSASPATGHLRWNTETGDYERWNGTAWGPLITPAAASALRNRVVNPAMQISQERGTNFVDCTTGSTYTIDQWIAALSTSPGGTLRMQQIASVTPGGSPNRLRATVQAADTTIAAGDTYAIVQPIEGLMIADARLGSASARQLLLRIGVRSSVAGTFGVFLQNSAQNRSWVGTITIAGGEINTDLLRTLIISGDTTGTWLTDTGIGLRVGVTLAAGTTFQGAAGWQAGNLLTTSAQTNFMSTASSTFELFDVGLFVDHANTGLFPQWEMPAFNDDLRTCQRYWEKSYDYGTVPGTSTFAGADFVPIVNGSLNNVGFIAYFRVEKRTTPVFTPISPQLGIAGRMRDGNGNETATGVWTSVTTKIGTATNTGSVLTATYCYAHWTASARF